MLFEKKIRSLNDLFLEELGDLYSAEYQLIQALPKMAEASSSNDLRSTIESHLEQTRGQAARLEAIFKDLGQKPRQIVCKAMKGLIAEGEEMIQKSEKCAARDAGIIGAAQRVEHYEIAAYGTAENHAAVLGHSRICELLHETLQEEKDADHKLNGLAEGKINVQANLSK
jgi:ferritin-like metal-binding protein YciE